MPEDDDPWRGRTHWLCNWHGVTGPGDDDSLNRHEASEHGGELITVSWVEPRE